MKSIKLDGKDIYPSKIVCIGRNYVDHIKELDNEIPDEPVIFLKPNSSVSKEIYLSNNDAVHFEGEISFVIMSGQIKGVGFGLDLTKREVQSKLKAKGLPWERSKAFDNSAVFSQFVSVHENVNDLRMELHVNGNITQKGGCELMLNKPVSIFDEAKRFLSFEDGDVIMTGTPKGVGPINEGDTFIGKIFEKENLIVKGFWIAQKSILSGN
jgi:2-keto-4-pentenoate hydratase/2-oxohepta-3-ene-1,7-dioic acid hydratase in catechol pathway